VVSGDATLGEGVQHCRVTEDQGQQQAGGLADALVGLDLRIFSVLGLNVPVGIPTLQRSRSEYSSGRDISFALITLCGKGGAELPGG